MKKFDVGYKKRYAVYGHRKGTKTPFSEFVCDTCQVYAKEQFRKKYPDIVIDIITRKPY